MLLIRVIRLIDLHYTTVVLMRPSFRGVKILLVLVGLGGLMLQMDRCSELCCGSETFAACFGTRLHHSQQCCSKMWPICTD